MAMKAGRVGVHPSEVDVYGKIKDEGGGYVLPIATSNVLGGVKPATKTEDMTEEVGVDNNGKLYVAPPVISGGKVYYKDFDAPYQSTGYYSTDGVNVAGYVPIGVASIDTSTGHKVVAGVNIELRSTGEYPIAYIYPLNESSKSKTFKARVYYVKASDIEIIN